MDLALAIDALVPAAEYGGSTTGNDRAAFEAIVWNDKRPRPSWDQIVSADAEREAAGSPVTIEDRLAALETLAARSAKVEAALVADGALTAEKIDAAAVFLFGIGHQ